MNFGICFLKKLKTKKNTKNNTLNPLGYQSINSKNSFAAGIAIVCLAAAIIALSIYIIGKTDSITTKAVIITQPLSLNTNEAFKTK